jgi:hypothetical protein
VSTAASLAPASSSATHFVALGSMAGTPLVGAAAHFVKRYGNVAGLETVVQLPRKWRSFVRPHAPALGLLGARRYPYAFVGDLVRAMSRAVHRFGDPTFTNELAVAGIDAAMDTSARVMLRLAATPQLLASRGQEAWNLFHDTGRVTVRSLGRNEYVSSITHWMNHDDLVCRICLEVRRRVFERTGLRDVRAERLECIATGGSSCVSRISWT